jgi:hypothetical protein
MALTDGVGGNNRTGGVRLNGLDQTGSGDPNDIGGMSTKDLLEKLINAMNPQGQQAQGPQGGGGGPQPAGGANQAGSGGGQFSLEELLKEMQRRAQLNQDEVANQLRQVRNTQQPAGAGQQSTQPGNLTNQLLASAPATFDVGNQGGGLTIQSGGGFGGGAFA